MLEALILPVYESIEIFQGQPFRELNNECFF